MLNNRSVAIQGEPDTSHGTVVDEVAFAWSVRAQPLIWDTLHRSKPPKKIPWKSKQAGLRLTAQIVIGDFAQTFL